MTNNQEVWDWFNSKSFAPIKKETSKYIYIYNFIIFLFLNKNKKFSLQTNGVYKVSLRNRRSK